MSTAYMTDSDDDLYNNIRTDELYFTFSWLLWGPSYELDYKNYWAGLCQLSFGDESNSLPAVADRNSNVIEKLREKFTANEQHRYGALLSADVSLYEKKSYYKSVREFTNPENLYFYDKIENGEFSFAVQIDGFTPCLNFKSKKYYCTAYVWLLFEIEDETSSEFQPEKCVAFFEHANLTDKSVYDFLIGTLIDKCLKHFKKVFSDPHLNDRKYRFVTAFNDKIAEEFLKRYEKEASGEGEFAKQLSKRLITKSKRVPAIAFSAFDDFFARSESLNFVSVTLGEKSTVSDLSQFYTDIYLESFPNENERETFDSMIGYLKRAEGQNDYVYHILLAKDNGGNVVGGAIFDYFKATNSAVIEFIAVKQTLQASGKGTAIYKQILKMLSYDANANKNTCISNIFCEIESPILSGTGANKHMYFWNKNNFKRLVFDYIQPALSPSQQPVTGLWFNVTASKNVLTFPKNVLLLVLRDYLKYCMQIEKPEENLQYIQMKNQLENLSEVPLEKIVR